MFKILLETRIGTFVKKLYNFLIYSAYKFLQFLIVCILLFLLFRNNPLQAFRLYKFIHRDLTAITSLILEPCFTRDEAKNNESFVQHITHMTIRGISLWGITSPILKKELQYYTAYHVEQFFQELMNFENSPYDRVDTYDANVIYSSNVSLDLLDRFRVKLIKYRLLVNNMYVYVFSTAIYIINFNSSIPKS